MKEKLNSQLNIGFDAKRLFLNKAGLGNYSRWLVKGLINQFPDNQYHLYTTNVSDIQKDFANENCHTHLPPNLFKSFWRSKGIKKDLLKDKIQIYHGLSHELPYGIEHTGIKSVVTIHDLIFKLYPEYYSAIDRVIYDKKFRSACERADKIVAISEHTKQCIIDFYKIESSKIEVIYLDASNQFHQTPNAHELDLVKKKYQINRPFFLNVGAIGGRKNQLKLVEAFATVASSIEHDLILIGKAGKESDAIKQFLIKTDLESRVKLFEKVGDLDLFYLYHSSFATVYPSFYEGFGIPIIESFRCGKPVITSLGSSLEEVCGTAGLLIKPNLVEDIAEKLVQITNLSVYQQLVSGIEVELKRFNPNALVSKYMDLYRKL